MKKLVSAIALLAVLIVTSSANTGKIDYLAKGDKAPAVKLQNEHCALDLNACKGEYVLLTFWSTSDAQSRANCNMYSSWFAKHTSSKLRHVSVNFDFEQELFEETVKLDQLDGKAQFNARGLAATQIIGDYNLQEGYGSVLIAPDGRITAFNPSETELSSLL